MPIELKPKTSTSEAAHEETQGLMLFNEDGELTLAGETVAEFLSSADFSAVMESPDAAPFLSNPAASADDPYVTDEGGEDETEDAEAENATEEPTDDSVDDEAEAAKEEEETPEESALPGVVAARLVDENDLVEMFGYYLDQLAENDDQSLQEQATLAVFENLRGTEGGIDEDSREDVAKLLLSVLSEGFVYGDLAEKIQTKSQRRKATKIRNRPQSGKRRAGNKKRRREEGRGSKKAKIKRQHKMRNRKKASRIAQLARESVEGTLVFGLGEGINGALFRIGLAEDPNMEFTDEQLVEFDEMGGHIVECPSDECEHSAPFASFIIEGKKKVSPETAKKIDAFIEDLKGKVAKEKGRQDYIKKHGTGFGEDSDESLDGACPECGCVVEGMLDEKGKVPEAFKKHMKKKKSADDDDDDGDDKDDKKPDFLNKKKGKKDEGLNSTISGVFAVAAGRPNLSEGSTLAASVLGVMGRRKPAPALTETED